jgi:cell division protein FtsW (lipid II flippase)
VTKPDLSLFLVCFPFFVFPSSLSFFMLPLLGSFLGVAFALIVLFVLSLFFHEYSLSQSSPGHSIQVQVIRTRLNLIILSTRRRRQISRWTWSGLDNITIEPSPSLACEFLRL